MKPAIKPRVPRPPPIDKNNRESITPHEDVVMRNKGHCLYDLKQPFAITLVSVSNVTIEEMSLVIRRLCL